MYCDNLIKEKQREWPKLNVIYTEIIPTDVFFPISNIGYF